MEIRALLAGATTVILAAVALAAPSEAASGVVKLHGIDSQNLAPFTLAHDSNVLWSCGGCSDSNFIFESNEAPGVVNALNHTRGLSFLPKGHYSGISIDGTGTWTITMSPAAPRKVKAGYTLTGVDATNLRPFTLTHDSKISWTCGGCSNDNFIFETNESPGVVNALNHTHGQSFLQKGHYTGVSVTAGGSWTITIS